ncbi:MAG TPA: protein kinase, partial [Planctomycetota bacterium]|nr:protein kinase [Planctomycetota bacterium]
MATGIPTLPGFELVSLLGRGGMGEVWKARQQGIGRWVAVKVLHPQFSEDEEYVTRFLREARTVGKLSHENIVRAFDCGQAGGRNYLVMEFVEGRPLDRVLAERKVFPEREALLLVRPIAEALQHAWDHRIIHRDVKPQNVLVAVDGTPKLCDLGLSRDVSESTRLTMTGTIACTPAYASPEQANGETGIDTRTDVYSLGVMLYELVTGELPFQSASPAALLVKHVSEIPRPPIGRNPNLSAGANRLILDMLEKLPSKRPATPGVVVSRIDGLLEGKDAPAPRTSRVAGPRRRRGLGRGPSAIPAMAIAGGIAAVGVVILAVAFSGGKPAPAPRPPETVARPVPAPPAPAPVPPRPERIPPAAPPGQARAEAALRALRDFRASHPDDLPAQIREAGRTLIELDGTPHFEEARRELESLRGRRKEELRKVRATLDADVRAAVGKEDFRGAIQAWKAAAAKHPDAPWAAEETDRVAEIRKAAETAYAPLAARAAEASHKGDTAEVESIRKRIAGWGMPGIAQLFEGVLAANAPPPKPPSAPPASPPPVPPSAPPPAPLARPKAPGSADRGRIRTTVRNSFKESYAKTAPEEVRTLAGELLKAARRSDTDPATRYVFLEEARDQAARGAHAGLAFSAVEGIVTEFDVDARKEWDNVLDKLKTTTREPSAAGAFVAASVDRALVAIRGDDYDLAEDLLKAAQTATGRSDDAGGALASVVKTTGELQRARAAHRAAQKDLEKLKANPDDPQANLTAGRFLCLAKKDWPRGLEHLLKGSDKTLREAAAREQTAGTDGAKLAEAAEGWMAAGEAYREHALDLYQSAWPGLSGEPRDRARNLLLAARAHKGV